MTVERHIADGEESFVVLNVTPDFCKVGKRIVAFDISQTLQPECADYASSVFARGRPVLMVRSIIAAVAGNAGEGIRSGVSQQGGMTRVLQGSGTVMAEDRMAARHDDLVEMNGRLA